MNLKVFFKDCNLGVDFDFGVGLVLVGFVGIGVL